MSYQIVICIPTYKRPEMLDQLLQSITACNVNGTFIKDIHITVVDNDQDKTAEPVVKRFEQSTHHTFRVHYHCYPFKGLANVRNELLHKAFHLNPDFIIFIDDDEYVTVDWLNELILALVRNNADAVRGPVIAAPTAPVPSYISWLLLREHYPDNARIKTWTAGNLAIRASSLKKFNVQFDNRFNKTGSEDSYFGIQMAKKGASIFWAERAVAFEVIPEKRTKLRWFIRRYYRGAANFIYMLKLERKYFQVLKKILMSFFYILIGSFSSVFLLTSAKIKYWGPLKVSEGIGGIAGFFNFKFNEYQ